MSQVITPLVTYMYVEIEYIYFKLLNKNFGTYIEFQLSKIRILWCEIARIPSFVTVGRSVRELFSEYRGGGGVWAK